jgi:hypothetical protein
MRSPALVRRRSIPEDPQTTALRRRWLAGVAWAGGVVALFAFLYRIELAWPISSDGANIALQSWDMLHGHLLLQGWVVSDAAFSTFEVPLGALTEALFGLSAVAAHLVPVLAYLIVAVLAVCLAVCDSRGVARVVRAGVVVAVLAAVLTRSGVGIPLEQPDHTGTSAFLLVSFLLIDRFPSRRFTAPLVCVILCAGQIGDATVRYTALPAIVVVCLYRLLAPGGTTPPNPPDKSIWATRKIRTADAAIAIAAAVSYLLATLIRNLTLHLDAYVTLPPRNHLSPPHEWPSHAVVAGQNIRYMFGAISDAGAKLGVVGTVFGWACLVAAAFGFVRVIWTWRRASRAEQLLCAAVVFTVAVYVVSTIPNLGNARDIIAVLPCGAVLAARACVPAEITSPRRAGLAVAAAAAAALLPLSAAATRPYPVTQGGSLATWLVAHHLKYGIAEYWDASDTTFVSGNQVQVRAVVNNGRSFSAYWWETRPSWYDAARNDATFAIADIPPSTDAHSTVADWERYFGRPARTYRVAGQVILVYNRNLLTQVVIPALPHG